MTSASAPGKIILLGEHAVVYGRPAVAIPLPQVRASAEIRTPPGHPAVQIHILAPDIGYDTWIHEAAEDDPLARAVRLAMAEIGDREHQGFELHVSSTIPIASGMGSGAAVTVAILQAVFNHFQHPVSQSELSDLAFQVEKLHHGTPSGIDNTVVTYEKPVMFVRGKAPQPFKIGGRFTFVIGDTGQTSPTSVAVGNVRRAWETDSSRYEGLFDAIGAVVERGRVALEMGNAQALGETMDQNQALLEDLGVSNDGLERLARAARQSGALGAKLSGSGLGGIMVALAPPETSPDVEEALKQAGAAGALVVEIGAP